MRAMCTEAWPLPAAKNATLLLGLFSVPAPRTVLLKLSSVTRAMTNMARPASAGGNPKCCSSPSESCRQQD